MEALIALLLASILGPLGMTNKVEHGVEAQLRRQLGAVKQVKVDIHRGHRSPFSRQVDRIDVTLSGFEAKSLPGAAGLTIGGGGDLVGKIGTVAVHARDFRVNDLAVSELEVSVKDIRYNLWKAIWKRRLRVMRVGDSSVEAALQADALTKMMRPRIKQLQNAQLSLGAGEVTVSGYRRVGVRIPVRLTCGLAARDGGKIYVVNPRAHVSVVPVPSFIITRLMQEINPIVDLNEGGQGPFKLDIKRITISPRNLRVRAALLPRKQSNSGSNSGDTRLREFRGHTT